MGDSKPDTENIDVMAKEIKNIGYDGPPLAFNELGSVNQICHRTGCKQDVNITSKGCNYYCMQHLRCGLDVGDAGPCKGCLNTVQRKMEC